MHMTRIGLRVISPDGAVGHKVPPVTIDAAIEMIGDGDQFVIAVRESPLMSALKPSKCEACGLSTLAGSTDDADEAITNLARCTEP